MATANLVEALAVVAVGAFPSVAVAAIGMAVSAGAVTAWNVLVMSLRQAAIPDALRGRVHGTWRTLLWGSMALGSVLGGLLARIDLTAPLLVGGGLATAAGLVWFRFIAALPNPEQLPDPDAAPDIPLAASTAPGTAPIDSPGALDR